MYPTGASRASEPQGEGAAASIRRPGARVDGKASTCKLSFKRRYVGQAKDAERPGPNGNVAGTGACVSPVMGMGRMHFPAIGG